MERFNRRDILNLTLKATTAVVESALLPEVVKAADPDPNSPENNLLANFENSIKKEKASVIGKLMYLGAMAGFADLTPEQKAEDLGIYFPMYKAAEIKYQVPWSLLWIIHYHETTVSRNRYPEGSGYLGAMQRDGSFYNEGYLKEATSGWEFLEKLPQRYHQDTGSYTSDYKEILFAARKIREDADRIISINPNLTSEEALLEAQENYCSPLFAPVRIKQFLVVKEMLAQRATPSSRGAFWPGWDGEVSE